MFNDYEVQELDFDEMITVDYSSIPEDTIENDMALDEIMFMDDWMDLSENRDEVVLCDLCERCLHG